MDINELQEANGISKLERSYLIELTLLFAVSIVTLFLWYKYLEWLKTFQQDKKERLLQGDDMVFNSYRNIP